MKYSLSFLLSLVTLGHTQAQNTRLIKYNDAHITYEGRIGRPNATACEFYWSGTSATVNFQGTGINAWLQDEGGNNYYTAVIDNKPSGKFRLSAGKQLYTLAKDLPNGKHTVQLFKDTEWSFGKTSFYGFEIAGNGHLLAPPQNKKHKIEFYGNSITCGYAIEDFAGNGNSWEPQFENNYLAYGAITARHFNAAYSCIGKSGVGLTVGWTPYIMPEIYDRLNPADSTSKWNFSACKPDVVVINLGENDASMSMHPEHANFKARFGTRKPGDDYFIAAYQHFFTTIRAKYPSATIIAVLGDMSAVRPGAPWPGYINRAVTNLHDHKLITHFFIPKSTDGHPLVADDQRMANELIKVIDEQVRW